MKYFIIKRGGCAICFALAIGTVASEGATLGVLASDLSVQFVCKQQPVERLEREIESFLRVEGFRVLNQGKVQREHGVYLSELRILGLDDPKRLIEFSSLPHISGRYSLRVNTQPPTVRSAVFESSIETFLSGALGCEIRQASRDVNAANSGDLFESELERVKNLFREAKMLQKRRNI